MYKDEKPVTEGVVLSRAEVRELDRRAIEDYGIPGVVLMENAGRGVACEVVKMLRKCGTGRKVSVVCGKGNNGGDGFVIARHLHNRGCDVEVFLLARVDAVAGAGDAGVNINIIRKMGLRINEVLSDADIAEMAHGMSGCGIVVDAIFGTGLNGELREPARSVVEGINGLGVSVVSVDIPSGLDCDNGNVLGACIKAVKTVTFAAPKRGFFCGEGRARTGELVVVDISIPVECYRALSQ